MASLACILSIYEATSIEFDDIQVERVIIWSNNHAYMNNAWEHTWKDNDRFIKISLMWLVEM